MNPFIKYCRHQRTQQRYEIAHMYDLKNNRRQSQCHTTLDIFHDTRLSHLNRTRPFPGRNHA